MKLLHSAGVLMVAGLLACTRAESQGGLTLEAKLPGGFAQVSNVVELGGGRIAFADTRNKLFLSANLGSGQVDTLGTRVDSLSPDGSPELYKFPGWVAHLAGDTLALVDFSALRTTLWSEAGRSLSVLSIAPAGGKAPVLVYDTIGHGYKIDYQALLGGGEPGRTLRPDSIPVLRIRLRDGAVDTVASLASPEFGDAKFGEQVQQAAKVFAPNDFFGVLPSGEAWVARGRENRIDWRTLEGRWSLGAGRDYPKQPVTQSDRERVLTQVREQGEEYGMPQNLPIEYPFADTKPPFEFALGRPNGEIWLQRPRPREDARISYDVVDRKGRWLREVVFPAGATLAGFGKSGAIYATIKNDDGTRTVGKFRLK